MGFKKIDPKISFAELALATSMEKNRNLKTLEQMNKLINWSRVENILLKHYTIGKSDEGADAYPPLMLFKCMLLQKWFRIPSDPELESQINDRISFKKFLNLNFDMASPDHCTFSRFRNRLSNDARLVQSANRPMSHDEIKKLKEKRQSPKRKLDKNGNPLMFCKDIESDLWFKTISLTTALKNMLRLISITDLFYPRP